jgi:hypothetical protein
LWPADIGSASASPAPSLVEHVDGAFLLFALAFSSLLGGNIIEIIARVERGERLASLLANHSL